MLGRDLSLGKTESLNKHTHTQIHSKNDGLFSTLNVRTCIYYLNFQFVCIEFHTCQKKGTSVIIIEKNTGTKKGCDVVKMSGPRMVGT